MQECFWHVGKCIETLTTPQECTTRLLSLRVRDPRFREVKNVCKVIWVVSKIRFQPCLVDCRDHVLSCDRDIKTSLIPFKCVCIFPAEMKNKDEIFHGSWRRIWKSLLLILLITDSQQRLGVCRMPSPSKGLMEFSTESCGNFWYQHHYQQHRVVGTKALWKLGKLPKLLLQR